MGALQDSCFEELGNFTGKHKWRRLSKFSEKLFNKYN